MKKLLLLIVAVSGLLVGCAPEGDMTSPPDAASTNAAGSGTSTNQ